MYKSHWGVREGKIKKVIPDLDWIGTIQENSIINGKEDGGGLI
jgi:hypothetical protein